MKTARKNAFTLIELLIVIAIIGVLAAVVLIAINPARRMAQARDSGRKSDIGQMATALQAYFTTNSSYPAGSGAPGGLTALTASGDLKTITKDPTGGEYTYTVQDAGTSTAESAVYDILEAPTTAGSTGGNAVWCWRSTAGSAVEITGATTCTP